MSPERGDAESDLHRSDYPSILACGYRHVRIAKSGRRFPAWLVAFPADDAARSDAGEVAGFRWAWRSKHDIWRLQRSTKATAVSFPKAAFMRLVDEAPWEAPWECPPVGEESQPLHPADMGWREGRTAAISVNNWHKAMRKNLLKANQYLQTCSRHELETVRQAWGVFSRLGDTENLVSIGDDESAFTGLNDSRKEQVSHELGQYFCSPENAEFVVYKFLGLLRYLLSFDTKKDILIVEPSVGGGDLVQALRKGLQDEPDIINHSLCTLGFDLDPRAIDHCREHFPSNSAWEFRTYNFLQTQREEYLEEDAFIAFIGGPPYSAGHTCGQQMDRQLPLYFVEHAILEWKAQLVVFLMPARSRHSVYTSLPPEYRMETCELPSSSFYFQGRVELQQPSVLQCFWKSSANHTNFIK